MEPLKSIRIVEFSKDPGKVEKSLYLSSEVWRESLTPEQHVRREKALEQRLLKHGMHTHRYSLDVYEGDGVWHSVSTMDVVERAAIVKKKGEKPKPTINYVFDAVFTPKQYRGHGYAASMLEQVIAVVREAHKSRPRVGEQAPLLTLWSDIGDYYTRVGFRKSENSSIIESSSSNLSPPLCPDLDGLVDDYVDEQLTLLDREQSQMAIDYHRAMVVGAIDVMTEKDGLTRSIVSPSRGILDQMQWRSEFVSQCLGVPNPKIYGARTANGWAAWSYMMTEKTLYILVMSGPIHEMVTLYSAALRAAHEAGGFKVVLYEADLVYPDRTLAQYFLEQLRKSGVEFTVSEPDHSIPYYYGPSEPTEDVPSSSQSAIWEFAGRYSWY